MKKILVALIVFSSSLIPAFAEKYSCNYEEGGTYYSFDYNPAETVTQFCKNWCDSDFWIQQGKCSECKNKDYPVAIRAFKAGACKKNLPPKTYNIDGCECEVFMLEDGTNNGYSCSSTSLKSGCDVSKSLEKLKQMLKK